MAMVAATAAALGFLVFGGVRAESPQEDVTSTEAEVTGVWAVVYVVICGLLVCIAGVMSGLTIGLMAFDTTSLQILSTCGSATEKKYASRILPLIRRHHLLLVTLLITNAAAMEALPIFLDRLVNPVGAVVISVTLVLLFGEIIPQALCTRFGLAIGGNLAWLVKLLMIALFPLGWPISKLLDVVLGHEIRMYRRAGTIHFRARLAELRELVRVHGQMGGGDLTTDEITIITGALDMIEKSIYDVMTPIKDVFMLEESTRLDEATLQTILNTGHSRIPIYVGDNTDPDNLRGVLLVKSLIMIDPEAGVPIKDTELIAVTKNRQDTNLYDALNEFQTGRSHIMMVTDMTGRRIVGIITLEDVIEELIQEEIADETDPGNDYGRTVELANLIQRMSLDIRRPHVTGRTLALPRISIDLASSAPRERMRSMDIARPRAGGGLAVGRRTSVDVSRAPAASMDIPRTPARELVGLSQAVVLRPAFKISRAAAHNKGGAMAGIVQQTINRVQKAVGQSDGPTLATVLKIDLGQPHRGLINALRKQSSLQSACGRLGEPYDEVMFAHSNCQLHLANGEYVTAYEDISSAFSAFVKALSTSSGNWLIPVLHVLTVLVRKIAEKADAHSDDVKPKHTEDAERVIKQCFRSTMACREPLISSKKWGALFVINNLFKIYFKLNNLRLCQNLIKYIPQLPDLSNYPLSQVVTYNYFVGRLALLEGSYSKARDALYFAFTRCTRAQQGNKRTVLMYLIPVQMLCGKLPTERLLGKYHLPQFVGLVRAYHNGNIKEFNTSLDCHLDFFIQKGIFLVLEKLKYIAYRNLFRNIFRITKQSKVEISQLVRVLQWLGEETDVDEVECIVANLIVNKYIKGYISHRLHTLVLSLKEPFPQVGV